MAEQSNQAPSIIRRKQVEQRVALSRTTIYDMVRNGTFPKPIALGAGSVGWVESEVTDWLNERISKRDKGPSRPASARDAA